MKIMNITKKRHLEIAIESIPQFESHNIDLEQYSTSPHIAADLLWNASSLGDIIDKNILDLGCGTGVFTLSSLLINAKSATGIDIDSNVIYIAKKTADQMNLTNAKFINRDIYNLLGDISSENMSIGNILSDNIFNDSFDTAITNPPFGSQSRGKKGADRIFMKSAFEFSNVVYSFHMPETSDFVMNFYEKLGGKITHKFRYKFPLKNTYDFHTQETKYIDVIVFRTITSY